MEVSYHSPLTKTQQGHRQGHLIQPHIPPLSNCKDSGEEPSFLHNSKHIKHTHATRLQNTTLYSDGTTHIKQHRSKGAQPNGSLARTISVVEVVSDYVYLGITMNYNNKYEKAIRKQLDQGRKAQFSLLVKANKFELAIDIQCNLFENLYFRLCYMVVKYWGLNLRIFWKYFTGNLFKKNITSQTIHTQLHGIW